MHYQVPVFREIYERIERVDFGPCTLEPPLTSQYDIKIFRRPDREICFAGVSEV